jgi:hypothetical protein
MIHKKDGHFLPFIRKSNRSFYCFHLFDGMIHKKDEHFHRKEGTFHEKEGTFHQKEGRFHEKDGTAKLR